MILRPQDLISRQHGMLPKHTSQEERFQMMQVNRSFTYTSIETITNVSTHTIHTHTHTIHTHTHHTHITHTHTPTYTHITHTHAHITYTHICTHIHTHFRHSGHLQSQHDFWQSMIPCYLQLALLVGSPVGEVSQCSKHSNLHLGVRVTKLADENWDGTKLPMYRVEQ